MDNTQKLKNRAEAMTELHKYINNVVPKVVKYLKKGFNIRSEEDQLFKKNWIALRKILDDNKKTKRIRAIIDVSQVGLWIKFDTNFFVSDYSVAYYEKNFLIVNMSHSEYEYPSIGEPLGKISLKLLQDTEKKLDETEDEYQNLRYEISRLKNILGK